MNSKLHGLSARYRWQVAGRVMLASVGGYGLSSLLASVAALALPWLPGVSRAEGVMIASLLSFVFYTLFVLWVFSTRSVVRVWLAPACLGVLLYCGWRLLSA
ncbi:iron transporter [Duganella sp. sic0402]|uniref:iron transporter n=1 Tax=Duganella sp. sic0402 TaxID=2854786 RepID=UPI001C47EFBE|nr:iron transporter [Duganella sp. sic0402]MBV7537516.1 iron transporter [Duganella sp. sic0402]